MKVICKNWRACPERSICKKHGAVQLSKPINARCSKFDMGLKLEASDLTASKPKNACKYLTLATVNFGQMVQIKWCNLGECGCEPASCQLEKHTRPLK